MKHLYSSFIVHNSSLLLMLRKIYYSLPVSLRFWVRRLYYLPTDLLSKRSTLIPPKGLIYTGSGDFEQQGKAWVAFFQQYAALTPQAAFLDIGSGIGRIAIPLTQWLKGQYRGFDAVQQGIDWCQSKITTQYPNFQFQYVDLFNDLYKNNGIDAASFRFPYDNDSFQVACAISVFTHMLPNEVENYLSQAHRVLDEGGYLVATFFILDEESKGMMQQNNQFSFQYQYDNYALMDNDVKAANVGFDRTYLEQLIKKAGFEISGQIKGHWCGRKKSHQLGFQDIMILKKGKN
jgi:SAM-dependent methyltransferase